MATGARKPNLITPHCAHFPCRPDCIKREFLAVVLVCARVHTFGPKGLGWGRGGWEHGHMLLGFVCSDEARGIPEWHFGWSL